MVSFIIHDNLRTTNISSEKLFPYSHGYCEVYNYSKFSSNGLLESLGLNLLLNLIIGHDRELSLVFCDSLEGWDVVVGVRFRKERVYVYLWLIHVSVQQKPTLKVIIIQLKIKIKKVYVFGKCIF